MEINTEQMPVSDAGESPRLKSHTNVADEEHREPLVNGESSDETVAKNHDTTHAPEEASNPDAQQKNGVEKEFPSTNNEKYDDKVLPVAVLHHHDVEEQEVRTETRVEGTDKVVASEDREVLQMMEKAEESENVKAGPSPSEQFGKDREKTPEADGIDGNNTTKLKENGENSEKITQQTKLEQEPSDFHLQSSEDKDEEDGNGLSAGETKPTENANEDRGNLENENYGEHEAVKDEEEATLDKTKEDGASAEENCAESEKVNAQTYLINQEAEKQVMHELIDETVVLEKDISGLQMKLEQTEAEKSELESKFKSLTKEVDSQKLRITELEEELKEAKMGDGDERKALQESQQRVKDLEEQLKRLAKDDDARSKKLEKVENDFMELTEKYKSLEQAVKSGEQNQGPKSKACAVM